MITDEEMIELFFEINFDRNVEDDFVKELMGGSNEQQEETRRTLERD